MINKYTHNLIAFAVLVITATAFLAANRIKINYTPYQILVWELKANEGYRSWWYKDGFVNGKQAYSIGCGWNDLGQTRRHEIAKYTKDGKVTYDEATEITIMELKKYGKLHPDPYRNLALQLYSYNCGPTKTGKSLGKCCGAKKWCGHSNPDVRKSHTRRRKFELYLWHHEFTKVNEITEKNKAKVAKIVQTL